MANIKLYSVTRKLLRALNANGYLITMNTKEFINRDRQVVKYYSLCKVEFDDVKRKYTNTEIYRSSSIVKITLYLRDLWYEFNGWEVPTDNDIWNNIKSQPRRLKNGEYWERDL